MPFVLVESTKQLREAMRSGAVLTQEQQYWPTGAGSYRVTDEYVLRDANGNLMLLVGSVISRAIRAGKVRSIPDTHPVRYEFNAEADE